MGTSMVIKFWGVHGSLPRPGPATIRYGGNTPCVEVRCGKELIILDAGTGIRALGEDILQRTEVRRERSVTAHIFFSHLHWDHVQGFPFFAPIFCHSNRFHLYGAGRLDCTVQMILGNQMSCPTFPVNLDDVASKLIFHEINSGDEYRVGDAEIKVQELNHPGGSFGFRVQLRGKSLVYATDTDLLCLDGTLVDFAQSADLLICDSMFTRDQYWGISDNLSRESWGHSTWEAAVRFACKANIKRLILFHHGNDDNAVAEMEFKAKNLFPDCLAAYEGLEIEL